MALLELVAEHLEDVGVDPDAAPCLATHALRPPGRSQYTRQGVYAMVNRALALASKTHPDMALPDATHPHAFRASRAIHLLDDGASLIAVRDHLGHVSVSTTQRYLRVRLDQRRTAVERAYPEIAKAPEREWRSDSDLMDFLRRACRGGS
jgi:integrase